MRLISNIKISNTTKILNFLLACFRRMQNLIRAIYELDISLKNGSVSKPDLFCLLTEDKNNYYSLFEFKQRASFSLNDINDNIRPQYLSYQNITVNDLNDLLVPRIQQSNIYINYLFYNSDPQVLNQIIKTVPIGSNVYLLNLNLHHILPIQTNTGNYNDKLMENVIKLSQDINLWNLIYVPFTYEDIEDFRGKGGPVIDIHNKSGIILTTNFMMFVLSRKIRKEKPIFLVDDFINYTLQNNFANLNVGWEYRSALGRKFRLFLQFICEELPIKIGINPICEKVENGYRILFRNTDSLEKRISEITREVIDFLKQKRISDFLK